jgi:hypothetical protein
MTLQRTLAITFTLFFFAMTFGGNVNAEHEDFICNKNNKNCEISAHCQEDKLLDITTQKRCLNQLKKTN